MVDPLTAGAIAASLANLITDILKDSTKDVLKEGADEGKKRLLGWFGKNATLEAAEQAIFSVSRKYVDKYQERHGILKVLGMRSPVTLESVYTAVCFLERDDRQFASIADLEAAFRQDRGQRSVSRKPGIAVANAKQFLMVLGAPGAGQVWLDTIGLDRETAMLFKDEAKALADYLYACELIVRCKESAVRVSPQTWEAIEGRMLLPPA